MKIKREKSKAEKSYFFAAGDLTFFTQENIIAETAGRSCRKIRKNQGTGVVAHRPSLQRAAGWWKGGGRDAGMGPLGPGRKWPGAVPALSGKSGYEAAHAKLGGTAGKSPVPVRSSAGTGFLF